MKRHACAQNVRKTHACLFLITDKFAALLRGGRKIKKVEHTSTMENRFTQNENKTRIILVCDNFDCSCPDFNNGICVTHWRWV